jgi:formylglycine-generating enzyme required for sulfatase activity
LTRILSVLTSYFFAGLLAVPLFVLEPQAKSKSATAGDQHWKTGETFRDCEHCPEMVVLPAGSFLMGSPSSERNRWEAEGPQHQVTIGYSFAVSKFPITRDEYSWLATEHGTDYKQTSRDPVVNISWEDAKDYATLLSQKTGKTYRLLSEAEYEYAERAGTTTAYWWGDSDAELCKYEKGYGCDQRGTVPVGSYPANRFGLYDMAGNVWEWTEDCWNPSYVGAPDNGGAWTTGNCNEHVLRGGSWSYYDSNNRSAIRIDFLNGERYNVAGFRVARTL